jgi:hypothetical protein
MELQNRSISEQAYIRNLNNNYSLSVVTTSRNTRRYLVIFTVVGMTFLFSPGSIDAFATSSMEDRLNKIQDNSILENPPELNLPIGRNVDKMIDTTKQLSEFCG